MGKNLFSKRRSDRHAPDTWSRLIRSHWFGSPITRLWFYLQRLISEISPLATSERFTLRRRRRIGVLKPHPKASVNGAIKSACKAAVNPKVCVQGRIYIWTVCRVMMDRDSGLGVRCTGSASLTTRVCSRRLIPPQGFIKTNSTYWLFWDLTLRRSYYKTSPSPLGWNRYDGLLLYLHSSLCCVFEVMTTSSLFADWIDFSKPAVLWSFVV